MSIWMTEGEIIASVRQAKSPKKQIRVLAELNAVSPQEIQKIVGYTEPKKKHPQKQNHRAWKTEEEKMLVEMIGERCSYQEMADRIGRTKAAIKNKISNMGLTRNI